MTKRAAPLIYVTVKDGSGNSERIIEQTHRILSLEYTDSQTKADKCVLTVDNFDLRNFDEPVWSHRNLVQVSWGYPGQMALAREVVITKVTGFTELKVEARAKSVLIDAVKRSRTFKGMTRSEVVAQIAREYGYTTDTLHIEDTGARFGHIVQPNISDAQLLRKLAVQQGFEFYVDYEGFHWHEQKLLQDPVRTFTWYTDPGRGDVLKIDVETDVTRRPAAVKRSTRDPAKKETVTVEATNETDKDRAGTAEVLLTKSADLRTGSLQAGYVPADAGPVMCSPDGGEEAAKSEVKAKFRAAQRGAVKIALEAVGDPTMPAKSVVLLRGVGQRLTGLYHVREVTHSVRAGGYTMKCKLFSDGTGATMKQGVASHLESGIPQVAGEKSKAKRTDVDVSKANAASVITGKSIEPDSLVAVPLKDKDGNVIGTAWREKPPSTKTVTIKDGRAVAEGES